MNADAAYLQCHATSASTAHKVEEWLCRRDCKSDLRVLKLIVLQLMSVRG